MGKETWLSLLAMVIACLTSQTMGRHIEAKYLTKNESVPKNWFTQQPPLIEDKFVYKTTPCKMNSVPKQDQRLEHEKRGGRFDNRKIIAQILSNDMRTDEFIAKLIAPFFTPCLYVSGKGPPTCCTTWNDSCYTTSDAQNNNYACKLFNMMLDPCQTECTGDASSDECKNCCLAADHEIMRAWNCPSVDCTWGDFSDWGDCSATCGDGKRSRARTIAIPAAGDGAECSGDASEEETCNEGECPTVVNRGWSSWGSFGKCDKACGYGKKVRYRSCTSLSPALGGMACPGSSRQFKVCKLKECPGTATCRNKLPEGRCNLGLRKNKCGRKYWGNHCPATCRKCCGNIKSDKWCRKRSNFCGNRGVFKKCRKTCKKC